MYLPILIDSRYRTFTQHKSCMVNRERIGIWSGFYNKPPGGGKAPSGSKKGDSYRFATIIAEKNSQYLGSIREQPFDSVLHWELPANSVASMEVPEGRGFFEVVDSTGAYIDDLHYGIYPGTFPMTGDALFIFNIQKGNKYRVEETIYITK